MRRSSRAGRFKKLLVPKAQILVEAPRIREALTPILKLYEDGVLNDCELVALYIITILSIRYPGTWPGAKQELFSGAHNMMTPWRNLGLTLEPNVEKRFQDIETLGEIFTNFALKSTPLAVNRALLSWSTGKYPLMLMFRIPMSLEVLDQQKRGHRCVTILTEIKFLEKLIIDERDCLSFTMHDLIHADHFYQHDEVFLGQLGFYGLLDYCYREGHFREQFKVAKFQSEFDYLISDMNAYAIHLLKCLKSALIHYHPTGEAFFIEWVKMITTEAQEQSSLLKLNTVNYGAEEEDAILLKWINSWRLL